MLLNVIALVVHLDDEIILYTQCTIAYQKKNKFG